MKTPQELIQEYVGRRKAILRALTQDVEEFYSQCDPERENLCLYGYPNGEWAVDLPAEEVPPEAPEPTLGINFARDGMRRRDWLALIAVHSDTWLLAITFYKAARFNGDQRMELFNLINQMPTCYEIISGKAKQASAPQQQQQHPQGKKRTAPSEGAKMFKSARQDNGYDDEDGDEDDEGTDNCPSCGKEYRAEDFWIACDACDTWFCGKCAKMTAAKAEKVKEWRCPQCED